jgi:hypothetical protein
MNERIGVQGTAVNWRCCPFFTLAERRTKPPGSTAAIQMVQLVLTQRYVLMDEGSISRTLAHSWRKIRD